MNYTKLAVRGAAIVFATSIVAAFLGYLVRLVMVRNLSLEDVGLFYSIFSFLSVLNVFKALGVDTALVKFIPEFLSKKKNDYAKSSIVYATVIQLINNTIILGSVYFFSSYLSVHYFHSEKAVILLRLMLVAFYIDSLTLILKYSFQGFKDMINFSVIDLVRMMLIIAVLLIGFKLNAGILSPAIAYILVPIILLMIFGNILFRKTFPQFSKSNLVKDAKFFREMVRYGIHVMAVSVGNVILGNIDIMVLTYFSGLASVGLYSVALPTVKLLLYLPRAIGGIMLPLSAELWAENKKHILKAGIEKLYKYSIIAIVPLVFAIFSFSDFILNMLFGSAYAAAGMALKILVIGMIFAAIYGININFFAAIGKPEINSKIIYSAAVFNLIGNLIMVPLIGIKGAAISTSVSYLIMMVIGLFYIKKYIKIKLPFRNWAMSILSGMAFIFVIFTLKKLMMFNVWVEAALSLTAASLAYIALLLLIKVISIEELKSVYERIFRQS